MVKDEQTTLDTETYTPKIISINGGDIGETGMLIKIRGVPEVLDGEWGKYYALPIRIESNPNAWEEGRINFTHKGLHALVVANIEILTSNLARIKGFGVGVNRKYTIELVKA